MFKNYISVIILAAISAFSINELSAQEKKEVQKVIVVEKSVDENGHVTEKKVIKEGKEAEDYIIKMKEDGLNIWTTEEGEEIDLDGQKHKIIKKQQYRIVTKDDEGIEQTLEWNGEGEMPDEIKKALAEAKMYDVDTDEKTLDVNVSTEGEKSIVKIMKSINGESEEIELEIDGDEISDDVRKILEEEGIDIKILEGGSGEKRMIFISDEEQEVSGETNPEQEKAQLGVYLAGEEGGVRIEEVIIGSAADEAGLKVGDIVTAVDDEKVTAVKQLIAIIVNKKVGDTVKVNYLRGTKNEESNITLKAKKELYKINWDNLSDEGNGHKTIKKKVIVKQKK